jgi:hypothetical protein
MTTYRIWDKVQQIDWIDHLTVDGDCATKIANALNAWDQRTNITEGYRPTRFLATLDEVDGKRI